MNSWARLALGATTAGAAAVAYGAGIERRRFTLREDTLPVLTPGTRPLRLLHVSDLHMTPGQTAKQRWVADLAALEPDLVVNTGDNLAHPRAVPSVMAALDPLLSLPGVFVFGSNDYFGPTPKNPGRYLTGRRSAPTGELLPWRDLRAAMVERGWHDATHARLTVDAGGVSVAVAGVDDPHLGLDRYVRVAGRRGPDHGLRLGLTHSPEPRVLDAFAADGYDLVVAGHTHGGQLRVPGVGAIVTNCGIDRSRARGASRWGTHTRLHVSAGLGTSPWAPVRFACPPEASLLTLVARPVGRAPEGATPAEAAADVG
ncbi:metallophosphoesterase [Pseudonocardia hydrocarbonoxydans]|uniref:Metallophosphoesterase n=1 Tax=Pseudonocardia hydrocarbonoxydans TaxID=76726 RepID=A0A4Y3WUB4_9PSEU|nr:metallophosphoesterase [Pseudonocardia hydrocarbonoxydans]GEC22475.1 metallophosphoesterase [Pseudonocardia hydrocarbonoxydans]